jgi:hypothetical protein
MDAIKAREGEPDGWLEAKLLLWGDEAAQNGSYGVQIATVSSVLV